MSAALDQVGRRAVATPATIGQQTAVEQARAVAEVAAAVQVARQFPRDLEQVKADVADACADYDVASEAFYAVQNRGEGLSVHLARELARIWGNFQYGVHELRRDDDAGESEVQAFAWDVQTNTRSTRLFVNPHVRMKDGRRVALIDVQDVYLSNQNTGARAVRECILSSLPKWLVNDAERRCRATLEKGRGDQSVEQRRQEAVDAFAAGPRVAKAQLEKRVGKPVDQWTAQDIASLEVLYRSLRRGETTVDEAFEKTGGDGQERVTAGEIAGQAEQQQAQAKPPPSQGQMGKIHALLKDRDIESDAAVHQALSTILQREITSRKQLTKADAQVVIDYLERTGPPPAGDRKAGDAAAAGGEQS